MEQIRPFQPADVPAVVGLFARVFRPVTAGTISPPTGLAQHVHEMYFEHPFGSRESGGWIAEDQGRCLGFLGCVPRTWRFGGRTISVAVGSNFMVAPEVRNPFLASQLLRSMFRGPFEMCLTDTGNESARRLWTQNGGALALHASLHWLRVLRPAGAALLGARERSGLRPATELARPAAWLADAIMGRAPRMPDGVRAEIMTSDSSAALFVEETARAALSPAYSIVQTRWLIDQAAKKSQYGPLHQFRLVSEEGHVIGWVLFYGRTGRIGQVLAVGGRPDRYADVLSAMQHLAHRAGCVALIGKADRGRLREYGDTWSILYHRSNYVLFRSDDEELREAVHGGTAHISRLEGDWWTRFQGEEFNGMGSRSSS